MYFHKFVCYILAAVINIICSVVLAITVDVRWYEATIVMLLFDVLYAQVVDVMQGYPPIARMLIDNRDWPHLVSGFITLTLVVLMLPAFMILVALELGMLATAPFILSAVVTRALCRKHLYQPTIRRSSAPSR